MAEKAQTELREAQMAQEARTQSVREARGVSDGPGEEAAVDLAELMDLRAHTYGMLARLYRKEVDNEVLGELQSMRFPTATGNAKVDEGYHLLYDYLRSAWDDSITELAVDYVRTFIGHGVNGYSAAYPYESVYTSERRLMMQEARAEVLKTLRENNLKRGSWSEGEDHVALELEFMQRMSMRTAAALRDGDEEGGGRARAHPARVRAGPSAELAAHADRRHAHVLAHDVLSGARAADDGVCRGGRGGSVRVAGRIGLASRASAACARRVARARPNGRGCRWRFGRVNGAGTATACCRQELPMAVWHEKEKEVAQIAFCA